MTTLLEANRERLRRIEDPRGIIGPVRTIFEEGKRVQLLGGSDATGQPFVPLAASTLKQPRIDPDPLIPQREQSRIITHYQVTVTPGFGHLVVEAGWPGLDWVQYHRSGTSRMPQRDPGWFRDVDRQAAVEMFSAYIWRGTYGSD